MDWVGTKAQRRAELWKGGEASLDWNGLSIVSEDTLVYSSDWEPEMVSIRFLDYSSRYMVTYRYKIQHESRIWMGREQGPSAIGDLGQLHGPCDAALFRHREGLRHLSNAGEYTAFALGGPAGRRTGGGGAPRLVEVLVRSQLHLPGVAICKGPLLARPASTGPAPAHPWPGLDPCQEVPVDGPAVRSRPGKNPHAHLDCAPDAQVNSIILGRAICVSFAGRYTLGCLDGK